MNNVKKILWTDADVRCPFYMFSDRTARKVCCEGYGTGVDMISRFRSLALKDKHMGRYCVGRYEDCPVYRCVYGSKYAE